MAKTLMMFVAIAVVVLLQDVSAHTYHLGSCPQVEGMVDFQMNKFLGIWYVAQKTSTGSSCLANNYTVDNESGGYSLEQTSQHLILGLTSVDHTYRYTGALTVPRPNSPANMKVNFPLSVAGSASYTVFATDYENYAGVFTCQKLGFGHRQSASILSRKRTLDKQFIDKIRNKLSSYGVDPYDLSIIDQSKCPTEEGYNINIDSDTFSAGSIAGVVRTAGDKLGDGIETLANGAKKVYHNVQKNRDREELSSSNNSNEAEWLAAHLLHHDAPTNFSIDPAHELALFIWNNGKGPRITHVPQLCLKNNKDCASYPMSFKPCDDPVKRKSIYFAVKTCGKFHKERIPVVKKTWAKYVINIGFYSEVADDSIPTIDVGVPNTERGHCGKTLAIIKHVASHIKTQSHIKWVVVVDDDTILSVARLQQLLSCYNPQDMTAIGERYGYNVQHSDQGYNYITGGGGMVFSSKLIQTIVKSEHCKCPSLSTPDDMFLGICLATLNVPITHSPLFHQARPSDYAPEYLTSQVPVSFHKHWMIDPLSVYNNWFAEADKQYEEIIKTKHVEL